MSSEHATATVAAYAAAAAQLAELDVDQFTHPELLDLLNELETATWQLPAVSHRILARLDREASPKELGAKSWKAVLTVRLRISPKEAARRWAEAKDLGPRTAFTGEPMQPVRARVAAAQAAGTIGPEHVAVIRGFFADLPIWVDPATLEQAEQTLVGIAEGVGPDELGKAAERLAALIDQDGPEPDDAERARKRCVRVSRQRPDGMSTLSGDIDPQLRATWEPLIAKLAAPGMCNPADEHPCTSGTPPKPRSTPTTGPTGNGCTTP